MFSDHHRRLKIVVALAMVVALGAGYGWVASTVSIGWYQCKRDPAAHDGQSLRFPLYTVTAIEGPDRYRISRFARNVPVLGYTSDLSPGATVSVVGTFRARDVVVVESWHLVHRWRPLKRLMGIAGLLCAILLAPRFFGVEGGRLRERGRG